MDEIESNLKSGLFIYLFILGIGFAFILFAGAITVAKYYYSSLYLALVPKPLVPHFYWSLKTLNPRYQSILESRSLFYKRLNARYKLYFEHRVARFLEKYKFEGREDIEITDEKKVLVAACYTKVNFGYRNYLSGSFDKIIIVPDAYYSKLTDSHHAGEFNPSRRRVVFSWKHFIYSYDNASNNLNLGLHEFAHVLKHESLRSFDISSGFFVKQLDLLKELVYKTSKIEQLIADEYLRKRAFVNNDEFFAVLVEHYFETPEVMESMYPRLFSKTTDTLNFHKFIYALKSDT